MDEVKANRINKRTHHYVQKVLPDYVPSKSKRNKRKSAHGSKHIVKHGNFLHTNKHANTTKELMDEIGDIDFIEDNVREEYKQFDKRINESTILVNEPTQTPNNFYDVPPVYDQVVYNPQADMDNGSSDDDTPENNENNNNNNVVNIIDDLHIDVERMRAFLNSDNPNYNNGHNNHVTDNYCDEGGNFILEFTDLSRKMRPFDYDTLPYDISPCEIPLHQQQQEQQQREIQAQQEEVPLSNRTQSRVIGSTTVLNKLPAEMKTCPCKCTTRNISTEQDLHTLLSIFIEHDWLRDGEYLQLFIPSYAQIGTKHSPAVIGTFRINRDRDGHDTYWFIDSSTQEAHCCPVSWFYMTYLNLCASGLIPDINTVADLVREQMKVKSNCFRFVVVQETNVTLYQMAANYRHDIGTQRHEPMVNDDENRRVRIVAKKKRDDANAGIVFKTREQLRLFFAQVNTIPAYPQLNLWMQAQNARISHLEQLVEGYRARLENNNNNNNNN